MKLLIGTKNQGKIIEIAGALSGLPVECLSPRDIGISEDPVETEDSFVGNALQKARFYFTRSHIPTLADDSGIIVDALRDELGIHTRRWGAGPQASDEEWIQYFLERMTKEKNHHARFICTLAYIEHEESERIFEGTCDGIITEKLEADYLPGLPISACFRPDGETLVYSAMTPEKKNRISHRGKAVSAFRRFLQQRERAGNHREA